jgi:hypothetical protein
MIRRKLELFADYYQFYIQDEAVDGNLSDAWTDEAVERLLAIAPGVVGVGTVRNMDVPVTIDVLDREPITEFDIFDHIVECSISIESGRIVVAGCTDYFPEAARIDVCPGAYRVRVNYAGLNSLSADGLDGNDRYHLQLWPAPANQTVILKHRSS